MMVVKGGGGGGGGVTLLSFSPRPTFYPAVSSVSLQFTVRVCRSHYRTIRPFTCSNITPYCRQYFWNTLGVVAPVEWLRLLQTQRRVSNTESKSVFQELRLGPDMITSRLLIFLTLSATFCLAHPSPGRPQDKMEINVDTLENNQDGSLGGELDTLISDIFNRIIKIRLENLLQGVTSPINRLESPEFLIENEVKEKSQPASDEGKEFLELSLPVSVTEIPSEVFTNLPGRHFGPSSILTMFMIKADK